MPHLRGRAADRRGGRCLKHQDNQSKLRAMSGEGHPTRGHCRKMNGRYGENAATDGRECGARSRGWLHVLHKYTHAKHRNMQLRVSHVRLGLIKNQNARGGWRETELNPEI